MFTRSFRNATGCLRCQFHLISPRSQSYHLRLPGVVKPQPPTSTETDNPEESTKNHDNETESRPHDPRYSRSYVNPLVVGEASPLGIDTLGQPGEVFVLEHGGVRRRKDFFHLPVQDNSEETGWSNLVDELSQEQNQLLDASSAEQNLERLRSLYQSRRGFTEPEWDEIRASLCRGFTGAQIWDYLRKFKSPEFAPWSRENETKDDSIWRPKSAIRLIKDSKTQDRAEDGLAKSHISHQRLFYVDRLMRVCWGLWIQDDIGRLDLHLPSHEYSMILNPRSGPLKELAETYGAKIEVTHSLQLVRVSGDKRACESIRAGIREFVSRIRSSFIDIPNSVSLFRGEDSRFDGEFLAWLEYEYGVVCKKHRRRIKIHYLAENETDAEEARRNVALGLGLYRRSSTPFCTYAVASEEANIYPVTAPDSMSWLDRRKEWFRWAKPVINADNVGVKEVPPAAFNRGPSSPQNILLEFMVENRKKRYGRLDRTIPLSENMTATVGKCLFLTPPTLSSESTNVAGLREMSSSRTFITDIPNTKSFLSGLKPVDGDTSEGTHRIRLLPSDANVLIFPPIELELDMPVSDSPPRIRKATVLFHEASTDLLLPENALDLTFTRSVHFDLMPEYDAETLTSRHGNAETTASILKCVEKLRCNHPITLPQPPVPAFCRIAVPKKLVPAGASATHGGDGGSGTTVEGEYMFPPLQSFLGSRIGLFDYRGLNLSFSHYNSGPILAAQTTHLSLEMGQKPLKYMTRDYPDTFRSFYKRACHLAFELGETKRENAT